MRPIRALPRKKLSRPDIIPPLGGRGGTTFLGGFVIQLDHDAVRVIDEDLPEIAAGNLPGVECHSLGLQPLLGRAFRPEEDQARAVLEDDRVARNPALAYVPEMIRRNWSEAPLDKKIRETFSKEEMQVMREGYHRLELFVLELRRAGGAVLAGSDNLNDVPGLTLHRELESLVAAGLTSMDALTAVTRDAASFLRRNDLGTIEPGKTADLIIVMANPLDNIGNLDMLQKLFQDGREIEIRFHRDYALPPARPNLVRPLFFERLLAGEK